METLLLVGLVLLNVLISWYNAKVCGTYWEESKVLGGFPRVLMWCGAVQSAVGFSMLFLIVGVFFASITGHLPPKAAQATVSLWYLMVIVPCVGTGLIITVHSWIVAWRERNWQSVGTAAWNTFATGMNIYDAANGGVSDAFKNLSELFSAEGEGSEIIARWVIGIALFAILGGIMLTAWIIRIYSRRARTEMPDAAPWTDEAQRA